MKKILLTSLITISIFLGGCEKFLETEPRDFISPETFFNKEEDAWAALGAGWDMLTRSFMYNGNYQYRMLTSDDTWTALSQNFAANLGLTANDANNYPVRWNQLYQTIQYCNILLANLDRTPMSTANRGILKGEGLFLRAFCYYELVKDWGAVPVRLTPTQGPNDVQVPATPQKELYDLIIKDMTEAEGLVPDDVRPTSQYGGGGYAAKTTVQAMLARVCLMAAGFPNNDVAKYQLARDWADKVVKSNKHFLNPDFTKVFINYATGVIDKGESLWEVDFNHVVGATAEMGQVGYLDGIPGAVLAFGGNAAGQFKVTRKLFNKYVATSPAAGASKDMRRDWTCAPFAWKTNTNADLETNKTYWANDRIYERNFAKFRLYVTGITFTGNAQSPINWPLIRYSDVLLMLAEAENQVNGGPTALAYDCINQVRRRAWGKNLPGATNITENDMPLGLNQGAFLAELKDERMRELAGEAIRKYDLKRWGDFITAIRELGTEARNFIPTAQRGTAAPNPFFNMTLIADKVSERDYYWPIPPSELTFNKLVTQNPGW